MSKNPNFEGLEDFIIQEDSPQSSFQGLEEFIVDEQPQRTLGGYTQEQPQSDSFQQINQQVEEQEAMDNYRGPTLESPSKVGSFLGKTGIGQLMFGAKETAKPILRTALSSPGQFVQGSTDLSLAAIKALPGDFGKDLKAEDLALHKLGKKVSNWAEKTFPSDPAVQDEFIINVFEGVGSSVGFLIPGLGSAKVVKLLSMGPKWVRAAELLGTAVMGSGVNAALGYDEAAKLTNDENKRLKFTVIQGLMGATEAAGLENILGRYGKKTGDIIANMAIEMFEEGIQEGSQQTVGNIAAKYLKLDPDREWYDGVVDAVKTAVASAGLMSGGTSAIGGRGQEGTITDQVQPQEQGPQEQILEAGEQSQQPQPESVSLDTPEGQEILRQGRIQFNREQEWKRINSMDDASLVQEIGVLTKEGKLDDVDLRIAATNRSKLNMMRNVVRERAKIDDANNIKMSPTQNAVTSEKIDQVNAEGSTLNIKEEKAIQDKEQIQAQITELSRQVLDNVRSGNVAEATRIGEIMNGLEDQLYGQQQKETSDVIREQTTEEVDVQKQEAGQGEDVGRRPAEETVESTNKEEEQELARIRRDLKKEPWQFTDKEWRKRSPYQGVLGAKGNILENEWLRKRRESLEAAINRGENIPENILAEQVKPKDANIDIVAQAETLTKKAKEVATLEYQASQKAGFPLKKGKTVMVNLGKGEKPYTVKVKSFISSGEALVEPVGSSRKRARKNNIGLTAVPVNTLTEMSLATAARERGNQLAELSKEERTKVQQDSKAFDDLLKDSPYFFPAEAWNEIEQRRGMNKRDGGIALSTALRESRDEAMKLMGEEADMGNPVDRARLLPKLKEWVETKGKELEGQSVVREIKQAEANTVVDMDLAAMTEPGDLVWKDNEWYQVSKNNDFVLSLKDGNVLNFEGFQDVGEVGGIVKKGDPGYDVAINEYKAQEQKGLTTDQKEEAYRIAQKAAGKGNEDIASDVYLGVLNNYDATKGNMKNYIKRSVANRLKTQGKQAYRQETLDKPVAEGGTLTAKDQIEDTQVDITERLTDTEKVNAIVKMKEEIDKLPERQKKVASMLLEGMTQTQIAKKLFVTRQAVSSIQGQIISKLKDKVPAVSFSVAKDSNVPRGTEQMAGNTLLNENNAKQIGEEAGIRYDRAQKNKEGGIDYFSFTDVNSPDKGSYSVFPGDTLDDLKRHIKEKRESFRAAEAARKNLDVKGNYKIVDNIDNASIPAEHKKAIEDAKKSLNIKGDIEGAYIPEFDTQYYFTDNINNNKDLQRVVMHETTARGLNLLREQKPESIIPVLDSLLNDKKELLKQSYKKEVESVMNNYPEMRKYLSDGFSITDASIAEKQKARNAVVEVMEHIGENRKSLPTLWSKVVRFVKDILGKVNKAWGNAGISKVESLIDNGILSAMRTDSKGVKADVRFKVKDQTPFSEINPNDREAVIDYLNNSIKILGKRIRIQERKFNEVKKQKKAVQDKLTEANAALRKVKRAEKKIKDYRETIQTLKDQKKDIKAKQTAVIKYAREHLPYGYMHKVLTKNKNLINFTKEAKLQSEFDKVIDYIDELEQKARYDNAVKTFKKTLKRARNFGFRKFGDEKKAAIKSILDTIDLKATKEKLNTLKLVEALKKDPDFILTEETEDAIKGLDNKTILDVAADDLLYSTQAINQLLNQQKLENKIREANFNKDVATSRNELVENLDKERVLNKTKEGKDAPGSLRKIYRAYNANMSTLAVLMDRAKKSGPMQKMVAKFRDGAHKEAEVFKETTVPMEDLYKELGIKDDIAEWQKKESGKTYKDVNGREFSLSKGERISVALLGRNEDSLRHLISEKGGLTLEGATEKEGAYKLDIEILNQIEADMSKEEKAVADKISEIFNTTLKDFLNKASNNLNGYSIAEIINYFPMIVDPKYLVSSEVTEVELNDMKKFHNSTVESAGALKPRGANANKPLIISDAFKTLNRTSKLVGKYYGYAAPLRWAKSFLTGNKGAAEVAIKSAWGTNMWDATKSMIGSIEEGMYQSEMGRWLNRQLNRLTLGTLSFNIPVAVMQTVSYNAALMELDQKYWNKGVLRPASVEKMGKYSPWLWKRYHEGEISIDVGEAQETRKAGKGMKMITKMDSVAVGQIWTGVEAEIKDTRKDLVPGSDAFYKAVAERVEYIVHETQPTFDTIDRPYGARQNSYFARVLYRYSSQLIKNYGMQIKSWQKYQNSDKTLKDKTKLVKDRAIQFVIQPAMIGLIRTATQATRKAILEALGIYKQKDDDDIMKVENFMKELAKGIAGATAGSLGQFFNAFASILNGFTKEDPVFNMFTKSFRDVSGLVKALLAFTKEGTDKQQEKKWQKLKKTGFNTAKDLSQFGGYGYINLAEMFLAVPALYLKLSEEDKDVGKYNF